MGALDAGDDDVPARAALGRAEELLPHVDLLPRLLVANQIRDEAKGVAPGELALLAGARHHLAASPPIRQTGRQVGRQAGRQAGS